jgi:hypothetical protein
MCVCVCAMLAAPFRKVVVHPNSQDNARVLDACADAKPHRALNNNLLTSIPANFLAKQTLLAAGL